MYIDEKQKNKFIF